MLLRFELCAVDRQPTSVRRPFYRRCRSEGITQRGPLDCLIAAVAWRRGVSPFAREVDPERVAEVVGIPSDRT